jgi:hypothetical protein
MVKKARVEVAQSQKAESSSGASRGFMLTKARAAAALKRQKKAAAAIVRVKACAKGKAAAAEARLKEVDALDAPSSVRMQGSVLLRFYTTPEQEAHLDREYNIKLRKRQAEIDAIQRSSGRPQKYTARFYLSPPPRVFHVYDGHSFVQCPNGNKATPAVAVAGGGSYTFDPRYSEAITEFCQRHAGGYKVVFGSGQNSSVGYMAMGLPAQLVAASGETLCAEDPESWDLCCG